MKKFILSSFLGLLLLLTSWAYGQNQYINFLIHAAQQGDLHSMITNDTQLKLFWEHTKKSNQGNLIPNDHLGWLNQDQLLILKKEYQRRLLDLERRSALEINPELEATIIKLKKVIAGIEQVDCCKNAIEFENNNKDLVDKAYRHVEDNLEIRVKDQLETSREVYPIYSTELNSNAPVRGPPSNRKERVLHSIFDFIGNPMEYSKHEALLQAEFGAILKANPKVRSSDYNTWKYSFLNKEERENALNYLEKYSNDSDLTSKQQKEFERLIQALESDKALPAGLNVPDNIRSRYSGPLSLDQFNEIERTYLDVISRERFGFSGNYPQSLKEFVQKYNVEKLDQGYYSRITKIENRIRYLRENIALYDKKIPVEQFEKFEQAQQKLKDATLRLDQNLRNRERYGDLPVNTQLRTKLNRVLRLNGGKVPPNHIVEIPANDALIERQLEETEKLLDELDPKLPKIKADLFVQAREKHMKASGRNSLEKNDLSALDGEGKSKLKRSKNESRLKDDFKKEYENFLRESEGKPYKFEDVLDPKNIKSKGGGIHFGSSVIMGTPDNYSNYVLIYDDEKQMLILQGDQNDNKFEYGPISPSELKPLFRFASTDENWAVSMDWDTPRIKSVLLNPIFVDTKPGRKLVLTDSGLYDYGDREGGKAKNPIQKEFKEAKFESERIDRALEKMIGKDSMSAVLIFLAFLPDSLKSEESNYDLVTKIVNNIDAEIMETSLVFQLFKNELKSGNKDKINSNENYFMDLFLKELYKIDPSLKKRISQLGFLPAGGQAVIHDQNIALYLKNKKLSLSGELVHTYYVYGEDQSQVGIDKTLSNLVNNHQRELMGSFPYLAKTRTYAEIIAFLRWADQRDENGDFKNIAGINFSVLGKYNASDPEKYPTPDEIIGY